MRYILILFITLLTTAQANLGTFDNQGRLLNPNTNQPFTGNLDVINQDWGKDAIEFNKDYVAGLQHGDENTGRTVSKPLNLNSKSIRGTVHVSQKDDVTTQSKNDVDKFLNNFSNNEMATNIAPVVYNYGGTTQSLQSEELVDSLYDLQRKQKKELRRQSQEMKKILEQNNRELIRQKMNYDLIHNWKPLGTR